MNTYPTAATGFSFLFTRGLNIFIPFALLIAQGACTANTVSAPTTPSKEVMPVSDTSTPTQTPRPSKTPSPSPATASTPSIIGVWSDAPAMVIPRSAHAVTNSDSAMYALAGTDDHGKPVVEVEVFDGNEWRTESTLPGEGLNAPTASIVDQKLYLVGGFLAVSDGPTAEVHVYDLQTRQWSNASPLPSPRGGHVAVVLDGRIHIFGGGNSISTLADHSEYDPAANQWRDLAPLPRAEGSPAAIAVNGKIHVIGGRSGFSDFGDVFIYDPLTGTWSTGPSIDPRGTAGAVYYCGGIYLFGGESQAQRKNLDEVWRLDLERSVWESVTAMPIARKFARAVVFMNSVYIVGGSVVPANSHSPIGSNSVLRFTQPGCS